MQRHWIFVLAVLLLPLVVGCEGCRPVSQRDSENEEQEKAPKEAYTTLSAITYPSDPRGKPAAKPGHWMTAEQSIRSNRADMRGELTSTASTSLLNRDLEVTGRVQSMDTVRPVVLPKGQMRGFEFRFRCPIPNSLNTKSIFVDSRLIPRSGGILDIGGQSIDVLQGSEYFFVILTTRPDQFTRFQVADWTASFEKNIVDPVAAKSYHIVIPDSGDLLPIPETMLDLTSTAVIFWDDVSENALTPLQFSAIADWIRFGGRLIVNGPDASEAIANTVLADVLPMIPTSNIELNSAAAIELVSNNAVASDRTVSNVTEAIRSESSFIAIDGQLDRQANAIEKTASLVLEKRVGRGHVIQPRFNVTDPWIENWDSYDSFINSVILNRPPRKFSRPNYSFIGEEDDELGYNEDELRVLFSGTTILADAAVNTQFRIFARDAFLPTVDVQDAETTANIFDPLTHVDQITGISAWRDDSDVLGELRETLKLEAGIEIPGSSLVIKSLTWYLIVLVPLNYLVFRLMNRLEYAWFAVPLIAVIGAAWAARQARLDIGFARSNTELAILEIQPEYPRAHLTRLIGVYNSLSDRYELQFASADGIASPLLDEPSPGTNVVPIVRSSFEEGPSLAEFAVPSNRMRYLHSEEMVDLGGAIRLAPDGTITNDADVELLDAVVIRRDNSGNVQVGIVGTLASGDSLAVTFEETDRVLVPSELPMRVDTIMRRVAAPASLRSGQTRLVARIDGRIAGAEISPSASQNLTQTVVVAHLQHVEMPAPTPDINLAADFRRVNRSPTKKTRDEQDQSTDQQIETSETTDENNNGNKE